LKGDGAAPVSGPDSALHYPSVSFSLVHAEQTKRLNFGLTAEARPPMYL